MSRRSPEGPEYAHFAMIYIDNDGNLCQRASDSVSESRQTILSPRVTREFLRAVAMSREAHTTQCQGRGSIRPTWSVFIDLEQFLLKFCLAGSPHLTTTPLLCRRGWPTVKWGLVNTGCKPHFNQSHRFGRQCGPQASLGLYKPTRNPRRISEAGTSTWLYTKEHQSL